MEAFIFQIYKSDKEADKYGNVEYFIWKMGFSHYEPKEQSRLENTKQY